MTKISVSVKKPTTGAGFSNGYLAERSGQLAANQPMSGETVKVTLWTSNAWWAAGAAAWRWAAGKLNVFSMRDGTC